MLEKLFKLSSHKTTVKTEILAGLTTFLAMAYILAVDIRGCWGLRACRCSPSSCGDGDCVGIACLPDGRAGELSGFLSSGHGRQRVLHLHRLHAVRLS